MGTDHVLKVGLLDGLTFTDYPLMKCVFVLCMTVLCLTLVLYMTVCRFESRQHAMISGEGHRPEGQ